MRASFNIDTIDYVNGIGNGRKLCYTPEYGYHPNASKSWLIVKQDYLEQAKSLFNDTGVSITTEGQRYLGAALGSSSFVESYVQNKINGWIQEINQLSVIAQSQPHAAYAAFTHGLSHKWSFLSRTIPNIDNMFTPLETTIRQKFLPALTGQNQLDNDFSLCRQTYIHVHWF